MGRPNRAWGLRHKNPAIHGAPGLGPRDPDITTTNTAVQNNPQVHRLWKPEERTVRMGEGVWQRQEIVKA